jgi:hypothetical protein
MKKRMLRLAALAAAALLIGCQGPPIDRGTGPIVGVKIYETDRDLKEFFDEWTDLGVNTAFVSRKIASRDEFRELAARTDVDVFVIFPVFFAPDELAEEPDLWAITGDGERAKEDWVEFACPSREDFRERRIEQAVEIARMCQPAGLSIDFIRYFTFWEMVSPDRDPETLPDTCYCPACLEAFAEYARLEPMSIPTEPQQAAVWIAANAADRWVDFKSATITSMAAEIAAAAREVDPAIVINIHVVPWRAGDYDDAITRVAGQDRPALSEIADYLSPMCYSFMLHREPAWVASVVEDVASSASCPVLPSIQVASAYREGEVFSPADFEAALHSALEPPSAGVVFWSWDHIEANPEKKEIIRRAARQR